MAVILETVPAEEIVEAVKSIQEAAARAEAAAIEAEEEE